MKLNEKQTLIKNTRKLQKALFWLSIALGDYTQGRKTKVKVKQKMKEALSAYKTSHSYIKRITR